MEQNSIFEAVFAAKSICMGCFLELKPRYYRFQFDGVKALAIYPYSQAFQSLIYLYKMCGDIELSSCFLERLRALLRIRYRGYVLLPAPSHANKIAERGFDHVPLMFQGIGKRVQNVFEKTDDVKQSDLSKSQRKKIGASIRLFPHVNLRNEKVLLVDDILTTGSTMRACLKLARSLHPKKIQILVVARTLPKKKTRI